MRYLLNLNLNKAEVAEAGLETALASYLTQAARKAAEWPRDGKIIDGNGNTIGQYRTEVTADDRRHMAWDLRDEGLTIAEVAARLKVSKSTAARYGKR